MAGRFVTEAERRDSARKAKIKLEFEELCRKKAEKEAIEPLFNRFAPLVNDILLEFANARELSGPQIAYSFPDFVLTGIQNRNEITLRVQASVQQGERLAVLKPDNWQQPFIDGDLYALCQAIADETGVTTDLTSWCAGPKSRSEEEFVKDRGEHVLKTFSPSTN